MLHVTNGDVAAALIGRAGLGGRVLPWRDVLHDGPVPADLDAEALAAARADFIAACGWGERAGVLADLRARDAALAAGGGVMLWFEHDLYDQLQLLQILDRCPGGGDHPAWRLLCVDTYLGELTPERLAQLAPAATLVDDAQVALARVAWRAFRDPDPRAIERVLAGATTALPFLAGALRRHLEQFPAAGTGLSRSEAQGLGAIAAGAGTAAAAFAAQRRCEERIFLGDTVFAWYLETLGAGAAPLLRRVDGHPLAVSAGDFWSAPLQVTDLGRAVLAGEQDRVGVCGIDRWLGGVHLRGHAVWRWNPEQQRLDGPS